MVCSRGRGDDDLVGEVDHALPHRIGLVVAAVHDHHPVVLREHPMDVVHISRFHALAVGEVRGLGPKDVVLVVGLMMDIVCEIS